MKQPITEMFELYLQRADLRPASVRIRRTAMKFFLEWFGDRPVDEVDGVMIEDYKTMLVNVPCSGRGGRRSKSAANAYLGNFKPFWSWLWKRKYIADSPFDDIRLYRVTLAKQPAFTPGQLSRLMTVASQLWRVRICLGLLGCRRGEMLNVVVRDINLSPPHPHILLAAKKGGENTWPWGLKDHASRLVGLPGQMAFDCGVVDLHKDIVCLMEKLPPKQPYLCIEQKFYDKMIDLQRRGKLGAEDIDDPCGNFPRMFRTLQKRAGIAETLRFHDLRAAFITAMIDRHDLSRAADAAGHSNIQTTRVYHRFSEMSLVADMSGTAEKCYVSNET